MNLRAAHTSLQAWETLKAIGGMEPEGRDEDLSDCLIAAISPNASTLEAALQGCSTDLFIRSLFSAISPYAQMFSAILNFFQKANSKEGKQQWSIVVDNVPLELHHFLEFQKLWESFESDFDVPAIDSHGVWAIYRAAQKEPLKLSYDSALSFCLNSEIAMLKEWFSALDSGVYKNLPPALQPSTIQNSIKDAAVILQASIQIIQENWRNRNEMKSAHKLRSYKHNESDGFDKWTIAQHETDFRLKSSVALLACIISSDQSTIEKFSNNLNEILAPYQRKKLSIRGTQEDLQKVLSLPVWKKRHELYAVWIATEIINSIPEHEYEIHAHQDDGKITFSFRETVIATVHSSQPKIRVYGEKRVSLTNPMGADRKGSVQPDYSLWSGHGKSESCGLVIEVKHYKKDAQSKFSEVVSDYARAHPQANVLLVSHGPVREYFSNLDYNISKRCYAIGEVNFSNISQREKLKKHIRDYIGNPIKTFTNPSFPKVDAIVIDISSSMSSALRSSELSYILESMDSSCEVFTVTTRIEESFKLMNFLIAQKSISIGGSTNLRIPTEELLKRFSQLLIITDEDGRNDLVDFRTCDLKQQSIENTFVHFIQVFR